MNEPILLILAAVTVILLIILLFRLSGRLRSDGDALHQELRIGREEVNRAARESREELSKSLRDTNQTMSNTLTSIGEVQRTQLDTVTKQLKELSESNHGSLEGMRKGLEARVSELQQSNEQKLEQMRHTLNEGSRVNQGELSKNLKEANQTLFSTLSGMRQSQNTQLEAMTKQVNDLTQSNHGSLNLIRTAIASSLKELQEGNDKKFEEIRLTVDTKLSDNREQLSKGLKSADERLSTTINSMAEMQRVQIDGMTKQLKDLAESNQVSLDRIRSTFDSRVRELQDNNEKKLEEMRKTVDEKLHETLERRLGDSFKLVSERLEAVQRGLGEMQNLATGVGDLQRVLSNVKIRGTWTEVQLGGLLEQILAPGQYEKNVRVKEDSRESVEYAIKLPGQKLEPGSCLWLPIDAKFPQEDYRRLQEAAERGDAPAVRKATDELMRTIKIGAQRIHEKYINPPSTTDFAIMFLATEGLYGEALRQPALVEDLQRRYRIVIAGPTTLAAILNSLRMGFETLAIEQRASEVMNLLGAIKTEFGQFSDILERVKRQLNTATRTIESTGVRTRAIERKLKAVEQLPEAQATLVLAIPDFSEATEEPSEELRALQLDAEEVSETPESTEECDENEAPDVETGYDPDTDDIPF